MHRDKRSRPRWVASVAPMVAVVTLVGTSLMLVAGPATAARSAVTFKSVHVDVHRAAITYSVNRRRTHITGRTCTLDDGTTKMHANCGRLSQNRMHPSRVHVMLRNLTDGTYTYTVKVSFKRSRTASATTTPFTVNGLVLDQSNSGSQTSGSVAPSCDTQAGGDVAQSVTPGRDGQLREVSVVAIRQGDTPDLVVTITGMSAGAPDDSILGTGTYTGPGSPNETTFIDVALTSPADLTQGQQYAIVLTAPGPTDVCFVGLWTVIGGLNTYVGGSAQTRSGGGPWIDTDRDWAFKTWLAP